MHGGDRADPIGGAVDATVALVAGQVQEVGHALQAVLDAVVGLGGELAAELGLAGLALEGLGQGQHTTTSTATSGMRTAVVAGGTEASTVLAAQAPRAREHHTSRRLPAFARAMNGIVRNASSASWVSTVSTSSGTTRASAADRTSNAGRRGTPSESQPRPRPAFNTQRSIMALPTA